MSTNVEGQSVSLNDAKPIVIRRVYKCDRCSMEHELCESIVKNKQEYIPPRGCYEGDYYVDSYYWFKCKCGRAIEVKKEHLSNPYEIEKEYSKHSGVCLCV